MGSGHAMRLSGHHTSRLAFALQHRHDRIKAWWRRRLTAIAVAELSAEQMRDCGIKEAERNVTRHGRAKGSRSKAHVNALSMIAGVSSGRKSGSKLQPSGSRTEYVYPCCVRSFTVIVRGRMGRALRPAKLEGNGPIRNGLSD